MHIIRDFHHLSAKYQGAVVALGNFDGLHLGHQAILKKTLQTAKLLGVPSAVMSFEPHPREFFAQDDRALRIYSFRNKAELLHDFGMNLLYLVRFNQLFSQLSADAFVTDILHRQLNVRHITTGYNFAFGKGRGGTIEFLAKRAMELGIGFSACPPVFDANGMAISSSAIRQHLAAGEMHKAAALLGRDYSIEGHVQHGERRGRMLGFPTINLSLAGLFKPAFGVYAVRVCIGNENQWHEGVANIGVRPTFNHDEPLLEAHLFAMDRDVYGQRVRVNLVEFIRPEQKFESLDALKTQIARDCLQAKELLRT